MTRTIKGGSGKRYEREAGMHDRRDKKIGVLEHRIASRRDRRNAKQGHDTQTEVYYNEREVKIWK